MNNWISTSERLPETEETVLIAVKPFNYIYLAWYEDGTNTTDTCKIAWGEYEDDFEYDERNDTYIIPAGWYEDSYGENVSRIPLEEVTYWLPLPGKPESEE